MHAAGRTIITGGIRLYRCVGALFAFRSPCRFYPSCSHYAEAAFSRHGFLKGSVKAIGRLLRCNPWNAGGIDYP